MNKATLDPWHATLPSQLVGFDRLMKRIQTYHNTVPSYPPYNVIKSDNTWYIEVAIAGFDKDEIDITEHDNIITITGSHKEQQVGPQYLHRGISGRDFILKFEKGEHVTVIGATVKDGLLSLEFEEIVPEELQAKKIEIKYKK